MIPDPCYVNLALALTKVPIAAILFILLSTVIIVLWQRQPKLQQREKSESTEEASQKPKEEKFTITPADGTVLGSTTVKFTGKAETGSLIVIFSNDSHGIAKTKQDGTFELQTAQEQGLNLVKVAFVAPTLELAHEKNLSLFISQKDVSKTVAAGSVKSIFDNLITITTQNGEKNIRTSKSTSFDVPEEEDVQQATGELDSIRIGDYIIATGDATDEDSIIAKNLQVVRQNKPVLTKEMTVGKIASNVRQNIFSVKNNKDSKLIEFTQDKNTTILLDGQNAQSDSVVKDKSALILYTKVEDTNLINLVYLLP